jgi:hypothetical protein
MNKHLSCQLGKLIARSFHFNKSNGDRLVRAIAGDCTQTSLTGSCCETGYSPAARHVSEAEHTKREPPWYRTPDAPQHRRAAKVLHATKFAPSEQTAGGGSRFDTELKGDRLDSAAGSLGALAFA